MSNEENIVDDLLLFHGILIFALFLIGQSVQNWFFLGFFHYLNYDLNIIFCIFIIVTKTNMFCNTK